MSPGGRLHADNAAKCVRDKGAVARGRWSILSGLGSHERRSTGAVGIRLLGGRASARRADGARYGRAQRDGSVTSELGQVALSGSGGDSTRKDVAIGQAPLQHALPELGAA